jgi:hypothetical protein
MKEQQKYLNQFKDKIDIKNYSLITDLIRENYFKDVYELGEYIRGTL